MNKEVAKKRIAKLRKLINYYRYQYHVLDKPEISDAAHDSLKDELFKLEQQFPEFVTPDSPTQRVGGKPLEKFEKVHRQIPMLSFHDAFSEEDLHAWLQRITKLLTTKEAASLDFYCEPKIDGLAIELVYKKGLLHQGSTRGDGRTGEEVTQNLKTIEAIPLRLREKADALASAKKAGVSQAALQALERGLEGSITVRGEVFIGKKGFATVNLQQEKRKQAPYANPRNLAAGSIRQLNPQITAARQLDSFAYDMVNDFATKSHEEKHHMLRALGFKTNPHNAYCKTAHAVVAYRDRLKRMRARIPYEIDGVVVTVNSNVALQKLGVVGKAPRGAIAFKFPLKEVTTVVEDITVQVGRTGALTPVAHLKPVQVGGVTVSRATLHNEDEIKRLEVKKGDTVIVGRAGDVIPDVIRVLKDLRTGKEKPFSLPQQCPVCHSGIIKKKGEVASYCTNKNCFAKQREYLCHFVSRSAFDIEGLGPKIIDQLLEHGLIADPADLFQLKGGDVLPLEGFAEKATENLLAAIEARKKITLPRFIYALGIRNVGEVTAYALAQVFGDIKKLQEASAAKLERISDVGPIVAQSLSEWFSEKRNRDYLEKLTKVGIVIASFKKETKPQKFKGKTFVLTGGLATMTREEATKKIRSFGGTVSGSVSAETDYVVAGEEPGTKYDRAKKLGIKIINEEAFRALLKK